MKTTTIKRIITDYLFIALGCILYSLSFTIFFQSNNLAMGGFTGLSQVINFFIPQINIGTLIIILNTPLMIIGLKKEGVKLIFASFFAIWLSSVLIDTIDSFFVFPKTNPLLACIFGSLIVGGSLGLITLQNSTTGGTELLARLIKYKIHSLSIGKVCLIIDITVICIYSICFKTFENALYGIISMYISSIAMDTVVYGSSNGKMAYIISDKNNLIMKKLLDKGIGVTTINGKGGFSGNEKQILFCALKKSKMATVKRIVSETDPDRAFMIVCDAKEVFGEGFGDYTGISL